MKRPTVLSQRILVIEEKKRLAEEKVNAGQIKLQAGKERLKLIHDRIVSEGQRQKEKMIAAAKQEARIMLETAHTKIGGQIRDAHHTIRAELIEAATEKALEKLPRLITDQDHERMIRLWMEESER
jgi:F-type H+-transporting ATPase subunit b